MLTCCYGVLIGGTLREDDAVVLRAYAHCGRSAGSLVIAMANVGNSSAPLIVPLSGVSLSDTAEAAAAGHAAAGAVIAAGGGGAAAMQWVLSGVTTAADSTLLNGRALAVSDVAGDVTLPSIEGEPLVGGSVSLPLGAVAFVEIQTTARACTQ
jgi:hypothetical protein